MRSGRVSNVRLICHFYPIDNTICKYKQKVDTKAYDESSPPKHYRLGATVCAVYWFSELKICSEVLDPSEP